MNKLCLGPWRAASSLVAAAGLVAVFSAQAAPERGPAVHAEPVAAAQTQARVIVKYRADSSLARAFSASNVPAPPQNALALGSRLGLALTDGRPIGARSQVVIGQGISSSELADRLAAQGDVEYAVVDGRMHALAVPNDPLFAAGQATVTPATGQWYLRPPTSATIVDATSVVSAINAQAAWNITTGNSSVVVAMLDTGIRPDHPDFAGKLRPGYDFISDTTVSNNGLGRNPDPSDPGDYGCTAGETSSWHGTQTSGLVGAATNNGAGMASVGYNVMLLPVRVLGKCGGYDSDIQAAMLWAGGLSNNPVANPNPAKVINLSLGSSGACSAAYTDIVSQLGAAGVVVVAAAGNDGLAVGTPANCPGVIAVAGVRHAGTKVGYSDLGPEIAISAPAGNCVNTSGTCLFPLLTTSNSGTTTPVLGAAGATYTSGGGDASLGTSFSAPLVSGTVALMFSANPGLTPAQVLAGLKSTARAFPSAGAGTGVAACTVPIAATAAQNSECYCTTQTCGAGLLDAGLAVAAALAPTATITVPSGTIVPGTAVTLSGTGSSPAGAITSYQWSVVSGQATLSGPTNASTVTVVPSAAGAVVVSLVVVDSAGQASSQTTLNVTAPVASSGGGGGGGAVEPVWLLAWLGAVAAAWAATPRKTRQR